MKEYVNKDMLIIEAINLYPESIYPLMDCGMGCVGCPASQMESLEQAAMVHGLDPDEVVEYVNNVLEMNEVEMDPKDGAEENSEESKGSKAKENENVDSDSEDKSNIISNENNFGGIDDSMSWVHVSDERKN